MILGAIESQEMMLCRLLVAQLASQAEQVNIASNVVTSIFDGCVDSTSNHQVSSPVDDILSVHGDSSMDIDMVSLSLCTQVCVLIQHFLSNPNRNPVWLGS